MNAPISAPSTLRQVDQWVDRSRWHDPDSWLIRCVCFTDKDARYAYQLWQTEGHEVKALGVTVAGELGCAIYTRWPRSGNLPANDPMTDAPLPWDVVLNSCYGGMRDRYQRDHDLFMAQDYARLRFVRWLVQTGQLSEEVER